MDETNTQPSRFLRTLRRSRLLSDEEIDPFVRQHNLEECSDRAVAREFLKSQLLTNFQAKFILHGRWRGLTIGDYRIVEPLSAGGMGEVYIARHTDADECVAIKLLKTEFREVKRNVERFRLEAFAVMSLKHTNLLRGIEYDSIPDTKKLTHYLVTDFVRGPNLFELTVIRRRLPWQQACDVIMQAAEGLHHAHERGFVHRDIKPGNLIIATSGAVKVLDFGLAQYSGPDDTFAFSKRKRRGTQRYAAPEQTVTSFPVDRRSDVYALGCTLFFALCGFPPSADSSDMFPSSRKAIERLRDARDDLPSELIRIVVQMIRRSPEHRFESAMDVADALRPLAKRLNVEVNFPALLRARDKSRKSEASWDTVNKLGATTRSGLVSSPQSANATSQAEAEEPSKGFAIEGLTNAESQLSDVQKKINETQQNADLATDKFADVYRRHRKQVDRLQERIETLEADLQQSKKSEDELRTRLNAKDAENEQIVSEYHETRSAMQEKIDQLMEHQAQSAIDITSIKDDHSAATQKLQSQTEALTQQLLELERRQTESSEAHEQSLGRKNAQINDLNEQIRMLQSQLAEAELHQTTMQVGFDQTFELQRSISQRLQRRLDDRLTAMRQSFDNERSKRARTAKAASEFHKRLASLRSEIADLNARNSRTNDELAKEARERKAAEELVRSSTARLNAVIRRANVLSSELNTFFQQISDGRAEAEFFESYEEACEVSDSEAETTEEPNIGNLFLNENFLDDVSGESGKSDE